MSSSKAVVGLMDLYSQAETAVDELRLNGFSERDISVVCPLNVEGRQMVLAEGTKAPEGALAGMGAGGALGGAIGVLAAVGALVIPGIGPIIAAGPLVAVLGGLVTGAAMGGVAGGLIGVGIPEVKAKEYEGMVKSGKILIAAHAPDIERRLVARRVLESHGATSVTVVEEDVLRRDAAA